MQTVPNFTVCFECSGDSSTEGQNFKSLVPCLIGTLIDWHQAGWACDLVQHMCLSSSAVAGGPPGPDYGPAGWVLAQHVFFARPDWAACICDGIKTRPPAWYSEQSLLHSIGSWGGDDYVNQILGCRQA